MIGGMVLLGLSVSIIFVPLLAEIIISVQEKEQISSENSVLNDKASGLFNIFYAIGCIIAPVIGGYLNTIVGFR
jgi:MFS family permease